MVMYCAPREYFTHEILLKGDDALDLDLDIVAIINLIGALTSIYMFVESRLERFNEKRKSDPSVGADEDH